jgi:DNA-binding MarR family transcriptional regulator
MSTGQTSEQEVSSVPHLDNSDELGRALEAFGALDAQTSYVRSLVAASLGIGTTDVRALVFMAQVGDVTPKRVAEKVGLSTGAITNMVDRMVAVDLIERVPNPHDRRSLHLRLAPAGQAAVDRLSEFYRSAFREALDDDQVRVVTELFSAVEASLARSTAQALAEPEASAAE